MKIRKDKSIGQVLFIVEGEKLEFNLLRRIFCDIFGYDLIQERRNGISRFTNNENKNSRVAVINTSSSRAASISDTEYLDGIFEKLINEKDFPVDKSAIFYLFDRDPLLNLDSAVIKNFIDTLQDPYDNGALQAGLFLLSYPSIEAFTISNFESTQELRFSLGSEAKEYVNSQNTTMQFNKITEKTLALATQEFMFYIREKCLLQWNVDAIAPLHDQIFTKQEQCYTQNNYYEAFSMLTAAFLYLGMIELDDAECT